MPVKIIQAKALWLSLSAGVLLGFLVSASVIGNGRHYDAILFSAFTLSMLISVLTWNWENFARLGCKKYGGCKVEAVRRGRYDKFLTVSYAFGGENYTSHVRFCENSEIIPGQIMGIYLNPKRPGVCMLAVYKKHRPGWTWGRSFEFAGRYIIIITLGLIMLLASRGILYFTNGSRDGFYNSAKAEVIGWESELIYNQDGGMVYEYRAVMEYAIKNLTVRARSVQSWPNKQFAPGKTVRIRYDTGNLQSVFVNETGYLGIAVIIFMITGFAAIGSGLFGILRMLLSRDNVGKKISYM